MKAFFRGMIKKRSVAIFGGVAVLALFFCIYSYLPYLTQQGSALKLNSPDETANYYFSKLYSDESRFGYKDELLKVSNNFIHPRSMTVVIDTVRPVGFIGLTLFYGFLSKIFSNGALLYYTPFIAVIAVAFFYFFVRRLFDSRIALVSAALLLIHPAYWYYASRGMMNNVLFVDLLLIGVSILTLWKRWYGWFFGGLFVGLSLMVRFSEVLWVGSAFLLWGLFFVRRLRFSLIAPFAVGSVIPVIFLLAMNNVLYGNPISFGYQTVDTSTAIKSLQHSQTLLSTFSISSVTTIYNDVLTAVFSLAEYILPFGFIPKTFLQNFTDYGIKMFWWLTPFLLFGIFLAARQGALQTILKKKLDVRIPYIAAFFLVTVWLVVFYGSWLFSDNITNDITIGNSYVRYWLPSYILAIPLIASTLVFLWSHCTVKALKEFIIPFFMAIFVFLSFQDVLLDPAEGLVRVAKNLVEYREKAQKITELTPENAVIFSPRSDKIFFPERHVAQNFDDFREAPLVSGILKEVPVYYYGFWGENDARYIGKRFFSADELGLEFVAALAANERLYKVVPMKY